MNHDETNSKSDAKPGSPPEIDPALEARVVAWVAGEASAFESAELERVAAAQPEVAAFKHQMENVQGLVAEAVRPDREPLRMSAERRAKLLQTIGGAKEEGASATDDRVVAMPAPRRRSKWTWRAPQIYFAASGLAAACLIVAVYLPEAMRSERRIGAEETEKVVLSPFRIAASEEKNAPQPTSAPASEIQFDIPSVNRAVMPPEKTNEQDSLLLSGKTIGGLMSPQSVPPPAPTAGASGGKAFREEAQKSAYIVAPAIGPSDAILKLDAFTVSESRDAGYGAIAAGRSNAAPSFSDKPMAPPLTTLSERLKDGLNLNGTGAADGRVTTGSEVTVTLGASAVGGDLAGAVTSPVFKRQLAGDEKKAKESVTVAAKVVGAAGKQRAQVVIEDQPLVRAVSTPSDADASLRTEVTASAQPASTFSLHVSDVSFRLAQAALARGELPERDRIRPEEFYNAFNYGDPMPTMAEKVGARIEQAAHPFLQQRNLVRIAVKVPATGRGASQPLRLTVLLDTSGSMEREDRAATVRRALQELVALLGPADRITLIGFSRTPRLLAESVPGHQAGSLVDLAGRTPAEGGTNLEAALKLGSELARRQAVAGAQNRIVLLTDGAANLGNAEPEQLAKAIETLRHQGVAFDACGIGLDGLDDAVLEALTRRGDGRYHVLNSLEEAGPGFARQLAGAFRPAAENVKLQVRFNPARVGRYRLIGFEQHRLKAEDFRNDRVDAAELAEEEAAVAVYQVEVKPEGTGELGEVGVRFRDAAAGQMVERTWALPYEPAAPAFDRATPSLQLAGTAALLAEKLRGGAPAEAIKLRDLVPVVNALRGSYAHEARVQEFVRMFEKARRRLGD